MRLMLSAQQRIVALERSEAKSARWSNSASLCAELAASAREAQVQAVFVLLPAPHQVDPRRLNEQFRSFGISEGTIDVDQPNRLSGEEMRPRELDVIDVIKPFRDATPYGSALYRTIARHRSNAAHTLLANSLEGALRNRLSRCAGDACESRVRLPVLPGGIQVVG